MGNQVHFGDNLSVLRSLPDASVDLIYIDPPFNTGKAQARTRIRLNSLIYSLYRKKKFFL